jgi:hypothetical protein
MVEISFTVDDLLGLAFVSFEYPAEGDHIVGTIIGKTISFIYRLSDLSKKIFFPIKIDFSLRVKPKSFFDLVIV